MFHKLFFKIWASVFFAFTLAIIAVFLLMDWSIKREFQQHAARQLEKNLNQLERQILRDYALSGNFNKLKNSRAYWRAIKLDAFDLPPAAPATSREKPHKPFSRYYRFVDDMVLVDEHKKPIAGHQRENEKFKWRQIKKNNQTIGFIGYKSARKMLRDSDQQFIDRYGKRLLLISPLIIFCSALFAAYISRRITVPIKKLSLQTHRLAVGDYSVQVPVNSADEIGDLCRNFNELSLRLAANQGMRNQWVADISHEMRTPIAVLKAHIEAMLDGVRPLDNRQLEAIAAKTEDLKKLVDDLFELSLSDAGSLTYRKEPLNPKKLFAAIVQQHKPRFELKNIHFRFLDNIPSSTTIHADEKRLRQLMDNVLENSCRYTDRGGEVLLSITTQSEILKIVVSDSAPSVAAENLEKIFERLYRAEASRSRETGGAGLGLAICKNIVAAHKGKIYARKSDLGGLDIVIEIPV